MFEKLAQLEERYVAIEQELADPEIFNNQERYKKLTKNHADMGEVVAVYRDYNRIATEMEENRELMEDEDPEMREMASAEFYAAKEKLPKLEDRLKVLLLPKDPLDDKDVILEVRAGTGGDEAALFAGDLLRMYMRYAERKGWKVEMMSEHDTGQGGYKEAICSISGDRVYSHLKFESGIHRVQRVPATESQGRVHTSACTVAIMAEAEEVDVDINPADLRIDVFRASGAGGQHVNTTDSAVRITHLPTNTVVSCQDEKSQHKNKAKAMKVLRSRILQTLEDARMAEEAAERKAQVGSGDRSGRIRTYNFPQGRLTDHRINLTLYSLGEIMQGDLDDVVNALSAHFQAEALKAQADG